MKRGRPKGSKNATPEDELALLERRFPGAEEEIRSLLMVIRGSGFESLLGFNKNNPSTIVTLEANSWYFHRLSFVMKLVQHTGRTGDAVSLERFARVLAHKSGKAESARKLNERAFIRNRLWAIADLPAYHISKPLSEIHKLVTEPWRRWGYDENGNEIELDPEPGINVSRSGLAKIIQELGYTYGHRKPPRRRSS